jgi:thiol-disulfide isomerase/thioredoxin
MLFATLLLASLVPAGPPGGELPAVGTWHAWLDSPGGPLPFTLELESAENVWRARILNGSEAIPYESVELSEQVVTIRLDPYDATLEARVSENGRRLDGEWRRAHGPEAWTRMEFHAAAGEAPRFPALRPASIERATLDGRWAVQFESDEHPAVGLFESLPGGGLGGTFLTTLGDYRFLEGSFDGERMRLSCFDGAHAFLFDARLTDDGRLQGDFWSRDSWHETFEAERDESADLPDPFAMTQWTGEVGLGELAFPDLEGRERRLDDPEFSGKARLIVLFGSWCPNCHDETRLLVELDRRWRDRGLAIQGLAFEFDPRPEPSRERLQEYARVLGVRFPLLVAGPADKQEASRAVPAIDRLRAYPTTLFLDRNNQVRWVHTGFSGPATGRAYEKLREAFETRIEELLNE